MQRNVPKKWKLWTYVYVDKLLSYVDKMPYFSSLNLNISLGSHPFDWCKDRRQNKRYFTSQTRAFFFSSVCIVKHADILLKNHPKVWWWISVRKFLQRNLTKMSSAAQLFMTPTTSVSRDSRLSELLGSPPSQGSRSFSLCSPLILLLTAASVKLSAVCTDNIVVYSRLTQGYAVQFSHKFVQQRSGMEAAQVRRARSLQWRMAVTGLMKTYC